MNFDFSEEQKLLQKTVRDFLSERAPLSVNRNVLETEADHDPELWKSAAEMGWLGAVVPEEYGGAGFGYLELVLIAEEVGRGLVPIPFSSSVYLATEALLQAGDDAQRKQYLPALASGDRIGTLAIIEGPGEPSADRVQATFEGGKLSGQKVAVPDGAVADFAIVLARSGGGHSLAIVDLTGAGVTRTRDHTIDPSRPSATVVFKDAPAELLGKAGTGWDVAQSVLDRAAILLAFEQIGGAQRAFDLTKDQIMGRYAFGRPIASFQAVKHRMADLYVNIELAKSNCFYGAWALENTSDDLGVAACNARVSATLAAELSSVEMVQLYGGVGYTWEYDCHMFYRRAKLQAVTLGSARHWRELLIQHLVAKSAA